MSKKIYIRPIIYFGEPAVIACDGDCKRAWGMNSRPRDGETCLFDDEIGTEAPDDPGTYEGGHAKPPSPDGMNKWCARECERSVVHGRCTELSLPTWLSAKARGE